MRPPPLLLAPICRVDFEREKRRRKSSCNPPCVCEEKFARPAFFTLRSSAAMDATPSNWHCSRFKEQESILGFRRRIRSENFSGSSSFSSRSLQAKRRRKPACTNFFPAYDGAGFHILAISSFTETDHRLPYSCRTGRAQGSLGYLLTLYTSVLECVSV